MILLKFVLLLAMMIFLSCDRQEKESTARVEWVLKAAAVVPDTLGHLGQPEYFFRFIVKNIGQKDVWYKSVTVFISNDKHHRRLDLEPWVISPVKISPFEEAVFELRQKDFQNFFWSDENDTDSSLVIEVFLNVVDFDYLKIDKDIKMSPRGEDGLKAMFYLPDLSELPLFRLPVKVDPYSAKWLGFIKKDSIMYTKFVHLDTVEKFIIIKPNQF